jgi:glutathione-regulated potassium-efflux system protein KefB
LPIPRFAGKWGKPACGAFGALGLRANQERLMALPIEGNQLVNVVVLLGAAVIAVPLFKRLGLGSVLGYLAAGLAIGPFGIGFFSDPKSILHVAELGVVMFLFIIGLEMQPSRLWKLRGEIFGLGVAQVLACGGLLTVVGLLAGLSGPAAFMAAMGFVLSSTAIVMQILGERDESTSAQGQQRQNAADCNGGLRPGVAVVGGARRRQ